MTLAVPVHINAECGKICLDNESSPASDALPMLSFGFSAKISVQDLISALSEFQQKQCPPSPIAPSAVTSEDSTLSHLECSALSGHDSVQEDDWYQDEHDYPQEGACAAEEQIDESPHVDAQVDCSSWQSKAADGRWQMQREVKEMLSHARSGRRAEMRHPEQLDQGDWPPFTDMSPAVWSTMQGISEWRPGSGIDGRDRAAQCRGHQAAHLPQGGTMAAASLPRCEVQLNALQGLWQNIDIPSELYLVQECSVTKFQQTRNSMVLAVDKLRDRVQWGAKGKFILRWDSIEEGADGQPKEVLWRVPEEAGDTRNATRGKPKQWRWRRNWPPACPPPQHQ